MSIENSFLVKRPTGGWEYTSAGRGLVEWSAVVLRTSLKVHLGFHVHHWQCWVHHSRQWVGQHTPIVVPSESTQKFLCFFFSLYFSRASRTLRGATQVVTFLSVTKKCAGGRRPNRRPITVRRGRPLDPVYSACDWLSDSRLLILVPCTIYTVHAQSTHRGATIYR